MFSHNGEVKVPAQQNLVKKYLPIGPAAIAAAVAAMEKRKPKTASSNRRVRPQASGAGRSATDF